MELQLKLTFYFTVTALRGLILHLMISTSQVQGWETVTTKSRLNAILEEFAPERRVFQKNWQWFVSDFLGMAEPFVDGMKI